jgi:hypothetical protein
MSLRQALAPRELTAPSGEEFLAWYGEGPMNPRVPIQGDRLMTEEGGAVGQEERVTVPYIQYLPAAWAPYFLAPRSVARTGDADVVGVGKDERDPTTQPCDYGSD